MQEIENVIPYQGTLFFFFPRHRQPRPTLSKAHSTFAALLSSLIPSFHPFLLSLFHVAFSFHSFSEKVLFSSLLHRNRKPQLRSFTTPHTVSIQKYVTLGCIRALLTDFLIRLNAISEQIKQNEPNRKTKFVIKQQNYSQHRARRNLCGILFHEGRRFHGRRNHPSNTCRGQHY